MITGPSTDSETIRTVRAKVAQLLAAELAPARDLILLGLDGVSWEAAAANLPGARLTPMAAEFPSTSATGWLSSMTGATVDVHGVPGVVFKYRGQLINVFDLAEMHVAPRPNIFSDARKLGYEPIALSGDLLAVAGGFTRMLLAHAQVRPGPALITGSGIGQKSINDLYRALVAHLRREGERPRLIWVHIDIDKHVHSNGYDQASAQFLAGIDQMAQQLARSGHLVVAWSDHGLVPTRHDSRFAARLEGICNRWGATMGGAGRTRWLYCPTGQIGGIHRALAHCLPEDVLLAARGDFFKPGQLAHARVGHLILVARGESFLSERGTFWEHGSDTAGELQVFFASWGLG